MASSRSWADRGRAAVFWAIVAQWIGIAVFLVLLLVGEHSRLSLVLVYLPRQPVLAVAILALALAPVTRRRVRVLAGAQVVAVGIVLFPIMGFSVGHSRSSDHAIRLASYNVFYGNLGRKTVADEIDALNADIIVLQATYSGAARALEQRFPDRTVHHDDDFILVSRYKLLSSEVPPRLPGDVASKWISYVLDTPSGPLRLFNVHPISPRSALFDGDDDPTQNMNDREHQFESVIEAAGRDGPPFVIIGDTNLPPGSAILRRHRGALRDAFEEVGFGFGYTFPSKHPWMRIDRAFARDDIRFLDMHVGDRGASDHRSIVVELEMVQR